MEHARLISIAKLNTIKLHKFGKDRQLPLCCAVYSRARSITLRPGQSARSIRGRKLNSNQGNTVQTLADLHSYTPLVLLATVLE